MADITQQQRNDLFPSILRDLLNGLTSQSPLVKQGQPSQGTGPQTQGVNPQISPMQTIPDAGMAGQIAGQQNSPQIIKKEKMDGKGGWEKEYFSPIELEQQQQQNLVKMISGMANQAPTEQPSGSPAPSTTTKTGGEKTTKTGSEWSPKNAWSINLPGGQMGPGWQILSLLTGKGISPAQQTPGQVALTQQELAGEKPMQIGEQQTKALTSLYNTPTEATGGLTAITNAYEQIMKSVPGWAQQLGYKPRAARLLLKQMTELGQRPSYAIGAKEEVINRTLLEKEMRARGLIK